MNGFFNFCALPPLLVPKSVKKPDITLEQSGLVAHRPYTQDAYEVADIARDHVQGQSELAKIDWAKGMQRRMSEMCPMERDRERLVLWRKHGRDKKSRIAGEVT